MSSLLLPLLLACLCYVQLSAQPGTYVLVHGGWHGAWCWKKVVPALQAKGHRVLALDLPGHGQDQTPPDRVTFQDYVDKVVGVANGEAGPVILVGHSMAGVVIAQVAEVLGTDKVSKLVFLDAFMPKDGESVLAIAGQAAAQTPLASDSQTGPSLQESMLFSENQKACRLKPENVSHLFYHDCSPEDVAFAKAKLGWQPMAGLATPARLTSSRYGIVPKVYILCTQAKDLDKSTIARRVPCQKIYTLPSSHSPFFSMPEKLVAILDSL